MSEMDFERYFTLDEAQSLLPVVEALLKRALEAKGLAEDLEEKLESLGRKVFLSGGMFLDIERVRRNRTAYEAHMQKAKDALSEIDAIGVQVKDLDTGLLDFPCTVEGQTVLLCWKMGESSIGFWHTLDGGFRGRQPVDERFIKKEEKDKPERPN